LDEVVWHVGSRSNRENRPRRCCRRNLDGLAPAKRMKLVHVIDLGIGPCLRMNEKADVVELNVEIPNGLLGAGLKHLDLGFRRQHADQFKGRTLTSRLIVLPDLRFGREGAIRPRSFIDVSFHVEQRSFALNDRIEFHLYTSLVTLEEQQFPKKREESDKDGSQNEEPDGIHEPNALDFFTFVSQFFFSFLLVFLLTFFLLVKLSFLFVIHGSSPIWIASRPTVTVRAARTPVRQSLTGLVLRSLETALGKKAGSTANLPCRGPARSCDNLLWACPCGCRTSIRLS